MWTRGVRASIGALLAGAASQAGAAFDCTDAFGNRYLSARPIADGGVQCVPVLPPVRAAKPLSAQDVASILGLADEAMAADAQRRGSLALLPPSSIAISAVPSAERISAYDPLIASVARSFGTDVNLLRAIVHVESRFNANAVSPKGAIGLMQVMPATAQRMGLADAERNLFEPEANLRTGTRYLRLLLNMFEGQPELAVAAYNAGEGAVMKYGREIPPYPETQAYVQNVMAIYRSLSR
ncbi:lytic transglycosylase domain-containing protein [Rhizobacter sp. SG703]|uniref:lytic transglycosylase domain-containing protein n=1 Tax=Rhizobacter sp. SG703 TaxID=2587140 RepID=UPI001843DB14|nr:lytic transglycosylase domain-containing protein [Rhizobacter sp. SG703]NKI93332.1 soluble lytic murein transglycosylase-like protein [Rhizobacter sp. SG703]